MITWKHIWKFTQERNHISAISVIKLLYVSMISLHIWELTPERIHTSVFFTNNLGFGKGGLPDSSINVGGLSDSPRQKNVKTSYHPWMNGVYRTIPNSKYVNRINTKSYMDMYFMNTMRPTSKFHECRIWNGCQIQDCRFSLFSCLNVQKYNF